MSKLFIIACEPSGDSHGASLIRELKKMRPDLVVKGLGGPKMADAGVALLHDMTKLSALGLGDVLRLYFRYRKIFYHALREVEYFQPDAIVLIDSPAFNLRFAKKINKRFPVIYYIAPQIWAWGMRRIHVIKKTVTKMLTILPFEKPIYDKAGVDCEFVGHPLLDELQIAEYGLRNNKNNTINLSAFGGYRESAIRNPKSAFKIGLLAGSRKKEVVRIFPLMLETAREIKKLMPDVSFFTHNSKNVPDATYSNILSQYSDVTVEQPKGSMHDLVRGLDFALIASGTATLETALLGTPFFLLYKASRSTYWMGRLLVKVKYLGLVNLLADHPVVPEFIQNNIHPQTIAHEVKTLLANPGILAEMKKKFTEVRASLGSSGASLRAARAVASFLK